MSYEENKERRASNFKTGSDIFMGLFYALIGGLIVYGRATLTIRMPDAIMEIPAFIVYILGTMLVIGGGFRFYRGIKAILPQKQNGGLPHGE